MLKLICINSKPITHDSGKVSSGDGLVEGEIYNAYDGIYIHPNNKKECYHIVETDDLKLVTRFVPVSEIDETELAWQKEEAVQVV